MPFFDAVTFPDNAFETFASLSVASDFSLTPDEFAGLKSQLGFSGDEYHLHTREEFAVGSQATELRSTFGFHGIDASSSTRRSNPAEAYVHYDITVVQRERPKTEHSSEWAAAAAALQAIIPTHAAPVDMRIYLSSKAILTVQLPLALPSGEAPGFSEIRGLRMVKSDPSDPESELYFVALDKFRDRVSVYTHASADISFAPNLLQEAATAAFAVASLAFSKEA